MSILTREELHAAHLCAEGDCDDLTPWEKETLVEAVRKLLDSYKAAHCSSPRVTRSEPGGYEEPDPKKLGRKHEICT